MVTLRARTDYDDSDLPGLDDPEVTGKKPEIESVVPEIADPFDEQRKEMDQKAAEYAYETYIWLRFPLFHGAPEDLAKGLGDLLLDDATSVPPILVNYRRVGRKRLKLRQL